MKKKILSIVMLSLLSITLFALPAIDFCSWSSGGCTTTVIQTGSEWKMYINCGSGGSGTWTGSGDWGGVCKGGWN